MLAGGSIVWLIWAAIIVIGATRVNDSAAFKSLFGMRGLQMMFAPMLVIALLIVFLLKLVAVEAFLGLLAGAFGFIFGRATSKSEA
jgi:hypothetical protein